MLFLVISEPRPEPSTEVAARRQRYWPWVRAQIDSGLVKTVHARVGRGAVVLFDVDSTATLHRLLNEWMDIIPAQFDIFPLIYPDEAQSFLRSQTGAD